MKEIDVNSLEPLLTAAQVTKEPEIRVSMLDAAAHFPLSNDSWQRIAKQTREVIREELPGSTARRAALKLAVQIPLLSLRRQMRDMAETPDEPDRDAIVLSLDEVRDASRIEALMRAARNGDSSVFEMLAAMPLEEAGISPEDIPLLSDEQVPCAPFWRALALARIGDFDAIEQIMDGVAPEPELFWGNPWHAYVMVASIRPIPNVMHDYLLSALARFEEKENSRLVQLIVWAATGIADTEGNLLEEPATMEEEMHEYESMESYMPRIRSFQPEPEQRLVELVAEGNQRATALAPDVPPEILIGNELIGLISQQPPLDDWPVVELALEQVQAVRPGLDDAQMAWVLARGRPARVIQEMGGLLVEGHKDTERSRLVKLLRIAGDHVTGRAGSPYRGAGSGGSEEMLGRGLMIDDEVYAAAMPPDEAPLEQSSSGGPPEYPMEEKRRVHAQIWQGGQRRNTFLTGTENVIRCWIGLPQPKVAAVSNNSIPWFNIQPEGLDMIVQLIYKGQTDSKPLRLPQSRDARSADCDLHIAIPEGERYVSVDIAFLYRGRIFEMVQVEAYALAPGEEEIAHHDVQVKVQASRREVVDLAEREEYDATIMVSEEPSQSDEHGASTRQTLRVFGSQEQGRFDLSDAKQALKWLNDNLFAKDVNLVRRREATGAGDTQPMLNASDSVVLELFRDMARHGATLFNDLTRQGFKDPGPRIQLLNKAAKTYVPLEFIYDRGYPVDDAKLCDGWENALLSDDDVCPVCSQQTLTAEQRAGTPTICPLGFWSLQKIIERLEPGTPETHIAAPSDGRTALPVINDVLFASSHKVEAEDRDRVWQSLTRNFGAPTKVDDWQQWIQVLKTNHPQLLLVLPHHDVQAALDYLEIGDEQLPPHEGHLSRGQLSNLYVNPQGIDPGPIVLLLGCRTGAQAEGGYVHLTRTFQTLGTSIVIGTLAKVLGRHAAPVASEFINQLVAVNDTQTDFGTIMRRVRRRMLANGYLMSLCLVALGDADWHLTPRPTSDIGGDANVSH